MADLPPLPLPWIRCEHPDLGEVQVYFMLESFRSFWYFKGWTSTLDDPDYDGGPVTPPPTDSVAWSASGVSGVEARVVDGQVQLRGYTPLLYFPTTYWGYLNEEFRPTGGVEYRVMHVGVFDSDGDWKPAWLRVSHAGLFEIAGNVTIVGNGIRISVEGLSYSIESVS